jgi:hypothetical protein
MMISATLLVAIWVLCHAVRDSAGGHALFPETQQEALSDIGTVVALSSTFDGPVQVIAVFFPVARFRDPGKARVERGFDQTVLPVFEGGFEGILNLVVGQCFGVVSAGSKEVEGIADNHDRRLAATAAIIFF